MVLSGSGAGESNVRGGGGGLDFFRSRWAQEKMPLLGLGGRGGEAASEPRSIHSFEFECEDAVGCTGRDLVESALEGSS